MASSPETQHTLQRRHALLGGSADVVSRTFERTVNMQHKRQRQRMRAFVLRGRVPQIALGTNPKAMPNFKTVAESDKVLGGPMPAGCLYAPQAFIDKNPATVHALASIDPEIAAAKLELAAVWTNDFAKKANLRDPKG